MPISDDRLKAILNAAQQRQNARLKTERRDVARAGATVGSLVLPMDKQAEAQARIQAGMADPGETGPEIAENISRASHDEADVIANSVTFGQASRLRSAYTGRSQEQINQESDQAKERLGPVMSTAGEIAGKGLAAAALPAAAFGSIPAAAGTSAALGVAGKLGDTLGRDKPAPSPGELAMTAGISATGGALGKYVGDRLGEFFIRKMTENGATAATDAELYKQVAARVNEVKTMRDAAATAMRESGATIKMGAVKSTTDALAKGFQGKPAYRIGELPYTKGAIQTLRKLVADNADDISLAELNEIRGVIRDSIRSTNGSVIDSVSNADRLGVDLIEKNLQNMIGSLDKNSAAAGSGDIAKGVAAWNQMNYLTQQGKKAGILAGAFDRADLAMKTQGYTFDRALSAQFKALYNSRIVRNEFRGKEAEMLRELAEGTKLQQHLNAFDRTYGHGMFSQLYNTMARVPRAATSRAATENARNVLENLAPAAAIERPSQVPGTIGALIGGTTADNAIADQLRTTQGTDGIPQRR